MKHLDQASLAPLGTEERTRLSMVENSHTPRAPSAKGETCPRLPLVGRRLYGNMRGNGR